MPCMGPGEVPNSKVEEVYDAVIDLLSEKYNLSFMFSNKCIFKGLNENRERVLKELREAIKNVLQQDIDEGW